MPHGSNGHVAHSLSAPDKRNDSLNRKLIKLQRGGIDAIATAGTDVTSPRKIFPAWVGAAERRIWLNIVVGRYHVFRRRGNDLSGHASKVTSLKTAE
jgi:hypothetical protein